jgi:hypothetical protein
MYCNSDANNANKVEKGGCDMRFGTLLIGGILGAAAAVYLTRGGSWKSMAAMTPDHSAIGNFAAKAADTFLADDKPSGKSKKNSSRDSESMTKLQQLIREDPAVMAQVNEILSAAGEPAADALRH